jgi:hypothetical protein
LLHKSCLESPPQDRNYQNSLLFSLLAGNRTCETGSIATASATTQSCANGDFPVQFFYEFASWVPPLVPLHIANDGAERVLPDKSE